MFSCHCWLHQNKQTNTAPIHKVILYEKKHDLNHGGHSPEVQYGTLSLKTEISIFCKESWSNINLIHKRNVAKLSNTGTLTTHPIELSMTKIKYVYIYIGYTTTWRSVWDLQYKGRRSEDSVNPTTKHRVVQPTCRGGKVSQVVPNTC